METIKLCECGCGAAAPIAPSTNPKYGRVRRAAGGDPNTQRACSRCRELKTFNQFTKFRYGSLGLSNYCRECEALLRRKGATCARS